MKPGHKKVLKIVSAVIVVLFIILVILLAWVYTSPLTNAKIKIFNAVPLPIASVNNHFIPAKEFILRYNIANAVLTGETESQTDSQLKAAIVSQLITEQETKLLAEQQDVYTTPRQVNDEYSYQSSQADLAAKPDFNQLLSSYGLDAQSYKDQVIQPQLLLDNLQTWFYSQSNLNSQAYSLASSLIQRIQNGESMESLAASYSQDSTGTNTGGDLGFVDVTKLLPEIQDPIESMQPGDIKIIPCRYGLLITRLEGKSGNSLHLREIFLKGSDFQSWYASRTKNYANRQFIKT